MPYILSGTNDIDGFYVSLMVDGINVAHGRNDDNAIGHNSVGLTRNIHLTAGQVVSVNYASLQQVYGFSTGYNSWFQGLLIYAD